MIAQKQRVGERLLSRGVYVHWLDQHDEYVGKINESIENSTGQNTQEVGQKQNRLVRTKQQENRRVANRTKRRIKQTDIKGSEKERID